MTWERLKSDFLAGVQGAYASVHDRLAGAIAATPETFRARVTAYFELLTQIRADLELARARLPNPPQTPADAERITRYAELRAMYDALVAGVAANAVPARTEVGVAPAVVLTVGVVGLSVAGVAWAVASYEYAVSLREQTGFLVRELDARVEAMRAGATLPATTAVPANAPTAGEVGSGWAWVFGGLALAGAAAVFVVPKLGKG